MLCSNCSKIVQPVVALDIDGTLGDFHQHFFNFAMDYVGIVPHVDWIPYNGNRPFKEWFEDSFGIDSHTWYDIKLAYRQGGMKRTMPAYPGARAIAEYIRSLGAELWLATTRPHNRLDNIDPDTTEWLRRHRIPYDHLIYGEDKYVVLGRLVDRGRVVAAIDDLPEMYDDADLVFGSNVPILRRNPYNSALGRKNVITHLGDDGKLEVGRRIRKWKEENS